MWQRAGLALVVLGALLACKGKSKASGPIVPVDSTVLVKAYAENEVAADQLYKGKRVLVTGWIIDVKKDFSNDSYVLLSGGTAIEVPASQCYFTQADQAKIPSLAIQSKATFECDCEGLFIHVQLKNCTVR